LELHTRKIKHLQLQLRDLEEEATHLRRDQFTLGSSRTTASSSLSQRSSGATTADDMLTDDDVPCLLPPVLAFDRSTSSPILPRTSSLTWVLGSSPSPSPSPRLATAPQHSSTYPMPHLDLPPPANTSLGNRSSGHRSARSTAGATDGGTSTESCTDSYSCTSLSTQLGELEADVVTEREADDTDTDVRSPRPITRVADVRCHPLDRAAGTPSPEATADQPARLLVEVAEPVPPATETHAAATAKPSASTDSAEAVQPAAPPAQQQSTGASGECIPVVNAKLTPALLHPMLILNNKVLDERERRAIAAFLVCVSWDSQDWYDAMYAHLKLDAKTVCDIEDIRHADYEPLLFTRSIDEQHHFAVLWDALVLSLCSGRYDARNRVALRCLTAHLRVPWECIAAAEDEIAASLELKHLVGGACLSCRVVACRGVCVCMYVCAVCCIRVPYVFMIVYICRCV
jgi:hypothetical protein